MQSSLFTRLTQSALVFFAANTMAAEAPRWYEVELALISYKDDQKIDQESWPEVLIDAPANTENTDASLEQAAAEPETPWQWLNWWNEKTQPQGLFNIQTQPANPNFTPLETPFTKLGLAFEDKADKFEKAQDLKIVWSEKWRQPIPERTGALLDENQIKIDVKTALNFNSVIKKHEPLVEVSVSGNLYLYRSRYLHLVTDLTIQHWQALESNNSLDQAVKVLPNHSRNDLNIVPSNVSSPVTAVNEIPLRAARVQQSRRMRSTELHYIDHPMLGVLVRVSPIEK